MIPKRRAAINLSWIFYMPLLQQISILENSGSNQSDPHNKCDTGILNLCFLSGRSSRADSEIPQNDFTCY